MRIALDIIGLVVILTTALPYIRTGYWWLRIWDFPRLQIAIIGVAFAIGLLWQAPLGPLEWLILAGVVLAVARQAWLIYPFTPLAPVQVLPGGRADPERQIRFLVANVRMANRRPQALIDLVAATGPDVVLALEPDDFWDHALAGLDETFPFRLKRPQDNCYGMLLFSKLELRNAEVRHLIDRDVPSFHARLVLRSGDAVHFYAVHPRPPRTFQASFDRDAELLVIGREIHANPEPAIVAGDLNDVAWSHTTVLFQRISGLLDPRLGRGLFNTFHAQNMLIRWPLDHVFFDCEFRLHRIERLGNIGSDHFPMLVELSYEPEGADEQEGRSLMPGDRAEARRRIRSGRAS